MSATDWSQRTWKRGEKKRQLWSHNAVAAKARKRLLPSPCDQAPAFTSPPSKQKPPRFATVSIRIGGETATFRVSRWDAKRLFAQGKPQAASTIGKRVALVLENLL